VSIPLIVPDASVLLNWVLPSDDEPNADNALLLRTAILDSTVHAIVHGGCFVTADTRYVTKTLSSGSVAALNDWQPPQQSAPRGNSLRPGRW